ncbi:MAG: hypothetical protein JXB06_03685 [Spirochaetales bacterium]|nr:hypothetical protein [Spirochaetales bacterium]
MNDMHRGGVRFRALRGLWLLAGLLLLGLPLRGLDASFGGSCKNFLTWLYDPRWQGDSFGVSTGIIRLEASLYPAEWTTVELAWRLYPEIRPESLELDSTFFGGESEEYRLADFRNRLLPWSEADVYNISLSHDLDRAAITFHLPFADWTVGRQAVAWGSARIINPTDVIVPLRFSALESEYRRGVDAARLRVPFGTMNEFDAGCIFGKELRFDRSAAFGRLKLYLLETDLSMLAMLFREELMVGVDLARAVGNAGTWLEGAYVIPDVLNADGSADPWDGDYLRLSAGLDYNFSCGLYTYLELHFNSPGRTDAGEYLQLLDDPAYSRGGTYLLGRYYLGLGATYPLTPLLPATGLVLANLSDPSLVVSLSLEYNIKENVYLEAGCTLGLGENPVVSGGVPVEYRSEFGAYPNAVYTAVKLYF